MDFVEKIIVGINKIRTKPHLIDNVVACLSLLIGFFISAGVIAYVINNILDWPTPEHELTLAKGIFVILLSTSALYCGYYVYEKTKNAKSSYYYWSVYNLIIGWYDVFLFLLTSMAYPGLDLYGDDTGLLTLDWLLTIGYAVSFFVIARFVLRRYKFPHPNTFLKWTGYAFISTFSFHGLSFLIIKLDNLLFPNSYQLFYSSILNALYYTTILIALLSAMAFILLLLFTILYAGYEMMRVK